MSYTHCVFRISGPVGYTLPGPEVIIFFSCSTHLTMIFFPASKSQITNKKLQILSC